MARRRAASSEPARQFSLFSLSEQPVEEPPPVYVLPECTAAGTTADPSLHGRQCRLAMCDTPGCDKPFIRLRPRRRFCNDCRREQRSNVFRALNRLKRLRRVEDMPARLRADDWHRDPWLLEPMDASIPGEGDASAADQSLAADADASRRTSTDAFMGVEASRRTSADASRRARGNASAAGERDADERPAEKTKRRPASRRDIVKRQDDPAQE